MSRNKNIVVYDNKLNTISFTNTSMIEIDLFFSICSKIQDTNKKEIILSCKEVKDLMMKNKTRFKSLNDFVKYLDSSVQELMKLSMRELHEDKIIYTSIFNKIEILDIETMPSIEMKLSTKGYLALNALTKNFTKFDLEDLISIKGKYAKVIFTTLKQWRTVGSFTFKIDELKTRLGIPKSYDTREITRSILNPAIKELSEFFKDLKCEPLKNGRNIIAYKFTFTPEKVTKKTNNNSKIDKTPIF